jgi:hypothetical protein
VREFDQGRAQATALNQALAEKGCQQVEIDSEIGATAAELATVGQ